MISELVRKLVMPVVGFVIDKNLPSAVQSVQTPQVPSSLQTVVPNQLEQLQNAYAALSNTTPSPITQSQNYVNHPSYASATSATPGNVPYSYYGQAQLANYLASQPQLTKSYSSSQDTQANQMSDSSIAGNAPQTIGSLPTNQQLNQMTTQQLSQQLNQLINQYANSINQQANQQASQQANQQLNQQLNQQVNQQLNQQPVQLHSQMTSQSNDQNSQIYAQLQNLIVEQVKLKNQLQQLTKPKNYFAKEMQSDNEAKDDYQTDDESNLKDAPLNQIEQEYDRAQRWNTVLKNMDQFYNNDTSSSATVR